MSKPKKKIIEYRSYDLPMDFPVLLLAGEKWHISDVPSDKLHFHNCMEIGVCHTDGGFMEFDGRRHPFRAGDITFISRNIPHTTYSAPGRASLWSYLFFRPETILGGYFNDASPHADRYHEMLDNARFILHREEHGEIAQLVAQIMEEMGGGALNYQFSVSGLFLSLMMKLLRIYEERQLSVAARREASLRESGTLAQNALVIAPALDYIRDNYMLNFPMETLADLCHLSQTHFRRVFHEIMRTSPLDYLNKARVLQSCVLLRMTEDSILSVSERVGFRSISSFNRHFYAVMGVRPSDWRKSVTPAEKASILQYSGWMQAQVPG